MVKQSKTDPFREWADIYLGWTRQPLCHVSAVLAYMVKRKGGPGPLFHFEDEQALTRPALVLHVKRALEAAGVSSVGFSGHTFHIGAATTAAERRVEDSVVRDLGRWRSTAFLKYIRRKRLNLAQLSEVMARPSGTRGGQ